MLKYLRLQQKFDAAAMQAELLTMDAALWSRHYNTSMYEGGWTVLPLRSLGGSLENIISVHRGTGTAQEYNDTVLLQHCPYMRSVLDYFKCNKTAVRLMKLDAGAVIKEHSDHALSFEEGEVRLHIPVITNDGLEFLLENESVRMQEGECWYLNLSLKHAVYNHSSIDRVHLVIDLQVNDWLKQLFAEEAAEIKQMDGNKATVYSRQTQLEIIAQLRQMNTETSLAMADKIEKELT